MGSVTVGPFYFGEPWGLADGTEHRVATPVGLACMWCGEKIVDGDQGIMQAILREAGPSVEPMHRECALRQVVGSLAHLERRCSCYGGDEDEDDRMSDREEALAVWDRFSTTHSP